MSEQEIPQNEGRLPMPQYAMALAHVASLRSEDPYRKVGAVAIDFANRVIGTGYNGLAPGYDAHEVALPSRLVGGPKKNGARFERGNGGRLRPRACVSRSAILLVRRRRPLFLPGLSD